MNDNTSRRVAQFIPDSIIQTEPTEDEKAGMAWWNALTTDERAQWLHLAKSAAPADAWDVYNGRPLRTTPRFL